MPIAVNYGMKGNQQSGVSLYRNCNHQSLAILARLEYQTALSRHQPRTLHRLRQNIHREFTSSPVFFDEQTQPAKEAADPIRGPVRDRVQNPLRRLLPGQTDRSLFGE